MAQPIAIRLNTGPISTVETVTPDIAGEWLATNTHNRHLRKTLVEAYARDMREGRWQFTGEPIKFATDGTLLDGQHRLHAVVRAEVDLPLLVVRGLSPAAQDAMDTGSRRTTADALSLRGEKNAVVMSALAKMILTEGDRYQRTCSTGEVAAVIEADPMVRMVCNDILPGLRTPIATPAVLAYAYWRLDKVSTDGAATFFNALTSLVGLPSGSPILALHRRLSGADGRQKGRSRMYRQETLACIFMAWNAWARREPRSIIKIAYSEGRIAVPEPVVPR